MNVTLISTQPLHRKSCMQTCSHIECDDCGDETHERPSSEPNPTGTSAKFCIRNASVVQLLDDEELDDDEELLLLDDLELDEELEDELLLNELDDEYDEELDVDEDEEKDEELDELDDESQGYTSSIT